MTNGKNYWLVGATWKGNNQQEDFYRRGYWEMGYSDEDKPNFAKKRDSIQPGDRVAIKSRNGQSATTIKIHAIGVVKEVAHGKVFIDWKVTDLNRDVHSRGAFGTIHGPYGSDNAWTHETFCL